MKKEDTVKLISAEGIEFVIDKEAAMVSQTIRNMLTSPGRSISVSYLLIWSFRETGVFWVLACFLMGKGLIFRFG